MAKGIPKFYFLIGIAIVAVGYFLYQYAVGSPYLISSAKAKNMLKKGEFDVILDVRTDFERSALGHYPGDIHIESADLEREMPKRFPDKSVRILAYCNTGHRARMATEKLHALGYANSVYIVSGFGSLQ